MRHATVARLTSSIYGTVLTIALIAAYSAEEDLDPVLVATALLVTLGVFWLAHTQADWVAHPEGLNNAGDWYPETLLLPTPLTPYDPAAG